MTQTPFMLCGTSPIYQMPGGSYRGLGGFDSDSDGVGGNAENDPDFQPTTSLRHADGTSINARIEKGGVMPGKLVRAIPGIVLGCQGRILDVVSGIVSSFVVHDIGPDESFGEGTIALAQFMRIPSSPTTGGTHEARFIWEIWPGIPAVVGSMKYALQRL
jgi:hypothetical protein